MKNGGRLGKCNKTKTNLHLNKRTKGLQNYRIMLNLNKVLRI
jgi:hypothetical protein